MKSIQLLALNDFCGCNDYDDSFYDDSFYDDSSLRRNLGSEQQEPPERVAVQVPNHSYLLYHRAHLDSHWQILYE